eukprot:365425-Chlamydomonas_euryale.AAC.7
MYGCDCYAYGLLASGLVDLVVGARGVDVWGRVGCRTSKVGARGRAGEGGGCIHEQPLAHAVSFYTLAVLLTQTLPTLYLQHPHTSHVQHTSSTRLPRASRTCNPACIDPKPTHLLRKAYYTYSPAHTDAKWRPETVLGHSAGAHRRPTPGPQASESHTLPRACSVKGVSKPCLASRMRQSRVWLDG